jgi:hypothetical protein
MNEIPKDQKKIQPAEGVSQHNELLTVSHRHASALVALACFFMVIVFLGGYFLGKQHMIEHFVAKGEQDSFADQIYSSLCALSDSDDENDNVEMVDQQNILQELDTHEQEYAQEMVANLKEAPEHEDGDADGELVMIEEPEIQPHKKYYAQLIGFSTHAAAEEFVKKQTCKKRSLVIQARESSTAKGKKSSWYQVATEVFTDRNELAHLVDRITKEENIKGAQISAC